MAKPDLAKLKAFYDQIRDDFIPKEVQESPVSKDRKTIAIYGKAGIGKSTTSCNLSAAAAQLGEKVMQVGCDPKRDSIAMLCGGMKPTILHEMQRKDLMNITEDMVNEVVHVGFNEILCVESGGPKPGTGCAGRGVNLALTMLDRYKVFDQYDVTFILLDVLGDTVCGGFAQPMRAGYAREVYIVTCGEPLTLYQTSRLGLSIKIINDLGVDVGLAGLINNQRGIAYEDKIVEEFAALMGVPVTAHVPRSHFVQDAELMNKCVMEAFPDSPQAEVYRSLTKTILANEDVFIPEEVPLKEIKEIVRKYTA